MTPPKRILGVGPWEDTFGYSRAVVAGPFVVVSGCTAASTGEVLGIGLLDPQLPVEVEVVGYRVTDLA